MKMILLIITCIIFLIPLNIFAQEQYIKEFQNLFPYSEYFSSDSQNQSDSDYEEKQKVRENRYEERKIEFSYDINDLLIYLQDQNKELQKAAKEKDENKTREIIIKTINKVKKFQDKYRDLPIRIDGFSIGIPSGISINIGVL